jgi:hypothetical protein
MSTHEQINKTVYKSKKLKAQCTSDLASIEQIIQADTPAQRAALPTQMPGPVLVASIVDISRQVRVTLGRMPSRALTIRFKKHLLCAIKETGDEAADPAARVFAAIALSRYCPAPDMPDLAGTTYPQMTEKLRADVIAAVRHITEAVIASSRIFECAACGHGEQPVTAPVHYHPQFVLCANCLCQYRTQEAKMWCATGTVGVEFTGAERDHVINHDAFIAKVTAEPRTTIDGNEFAADQRASVLKCIHDLRQLLAAHNVGELGRQEGETWLMEREYWEDVLAMAWDLHQAGLGVRAAYLQRRQLLDIVPLLVQVKDDKVKDRAPWRAKVCLLAAQLNTSEYEYPWFARTPLFTEMQQIARAIILEFFYGCCVCQVNQYSGLSKVAKLRGGHNKELEVCARCVAKYRIPTLAGQ